MKNSRYRRTSASRSERTWAGLGLALFIMPKLIDLTGQQFGRLTAVALHPERCASGAQWSCSCSCGASVVVSAAHLRSGHTRSCGCLQRETTAASRLKHGHARKSARSLTYETWGSMLQRCSNPNATSWDLYGGRGINVCERWLSFDAFLADMGDRPSAGHEIDRIDNNGNYEPGNCRWILALKNSRNRRSNRMIDTPFGAMLVVEAAERSGLPVSTLINRANAGLPADRMFDAPRSTHRRGEA